MPQRLIITTSLFATAFLLVLIISSTIAITNALASQRLISHLDGVLANRLLRNSEFDTHMARGIRELQTYVLSDEDDEYEEAAEALALAQEDINEITALQTSIAALQSLDDEYAALNADRQRILNELNAVYIQIEDRANVSDAFFDTIEAIEEDIEALSNGSRQLLDQEQTLVNALTNANVNQSLFALMVSIIFPLGFTVFALSILYRGIIQPIRTLADATIAFAEGRFHAPLPVTRRDEVGQLQRSFNTLFTTIQQQTHTLVEQTRVADNIRAQAQAAQQLADEVAERNVQISAQAAALRSEISERQLIETALIQARDAAQEANRAKSTFLATMSHELRTPLTSILGFSHLMERALETGDIDSMRRDLGYVQTSGQHLLILINDILDLSRIEAGKLIIAPKQFEITTLIDEVANTITPLVERGQNTLSVTCSANLNVMYSDATRVRQILLNLLSNAAKFTSNGAVTLRVEPTFHADIPYCRFAVADTGIGIAASQVSRLFQPFSQVDDSATRKYGGAGLGLALSQRLASALGGIITVTSEYGKGSIFTLELPLSFVEASANQLTPLNSLTTPGAGIAAYAEPGAAPDTGDVYDTIALCIDDDPAVGTILQQLLHPINVMVIYADSGASGLELARDLQPDIILLDVLMPEMDGWKVLAHLKADAELTQIPVIMLSVDEQCQQSPGLDAVEYLVKPIEPQRLIAVVQQHRLI
jgi:signal transduction histidine kinase